MIPEYNTTNCNEAYDYWRTEDESRFACKVCHTPWPNKVRIYPDDTHVCRDKHVRFHQVYAVLERLEHELLGDHFNALTVALKLSEEGII